MLMKRLHITLHLHYTFNKAYLRVAKMNKEISGFRGAGIWPTDPNKLCEDDSSLTDDREAPDIRNEMNSNETDVNKGDNILEQSTVTVEDEQSTEPQPGPSRFSETMHSTPLKNTRWQSNQKAEPQPETSGSVKAQFSSKVLIEKLAPLPGPITNKGSKSRAKQHSEIFTSTPLKTQLEIKQEKRNSKKKDEELKKSGTKKRKAEKVGKLATKAKKRPMRG
ncbi:hypothetical protein JTB14_008330 [Gonioctena quinquepunctata]|nr:hypothetical protein JTB14_008330 [Gonioctena quinquepunctata]